jgi:hypothetical protein
MKSKLTPKRLHRAAAVDPGAVLAEIAADPKAPPTARVAAAKALLAQTSADPAPDAADDRTDKITALAIDLLRTRS